MCVCVRIMCENVEDDDDDDVEDEVEDEDDNAEDEVEDKNKPLKQADSALRMACVYWFSEIVKKMDRAQNLLFLIVQIEVYWFQGLKAMERGTLGTFFCLGCAWVTFF